MNAITRSSVYRKAAAFVLTIVLALGCIVPAFADTAYYATWGEYTATGAVTNDPVHWNDVAKAMDLVFDSAVELFEAGDLEGARQAISDGYYGYYEVTGFERQAMGYISGSRKSEVELQFSACKSVCKNAGTLDEFKEEVATLSDMINSDADVMDEKLGYETADSSDETSADTSTDSSGSSSGAAAAATFAACFSIILREGFEAILIIGAIIAYISKAGYEEKKRKRDLRQVYAGCAIGVVLSFVLAWLLSLLKLANTAGQEVIEGCTALLAVVVLYYVSNWMLGKSESAAWSEYIMTKANNTGKGNSAFAMAFTAFLAVFREGAEVVLFYQPMLASGNVGSIWAGLVIGLIALVFVYIAVTQLGVRIPIRFFFTVMSLIMAVMSISFLGAGIKELIEGDVFTYISPDWLQWIPSNDVMDVFGIYPSLQTLLPQLALLILTVIMFRIRLKKNRQIRIAAEKKAAEERAVREAAEKKAAEEAEEAKITAVVLAVLADPEAAKQKLDAWKQAQAAAEIAAETTDNS